MLITPILLQREAFFADRLDQDAARLMDLGLKILALCAALGLRPCPHQD